jgi:hypothetical protein
MILRSEEVTVGRGVNMLKSKKINYKSEFYEAIEE